MLEEGRVLFLFGFQSEGFSISKSGRRKWSTVSVFLFVCLFLISLEGMGAKEMVPLEFRVGLPTSVTTVEITPHGCVWRLVS